MNIAGTDYTSTRLRRDGSTRDGGETGLRARRPIWRPQINALVPECITKFLQTGDVVQGDDPLSIYAITLSDVDLQWGGVRQTSLSDRLLWQRL